MTPCIVSQRVPQILHRWGCDSGGGAGKCQKPHRKCSETNFRNVLETDIRILRSSIFSFILSTRVASSSIIWRSYSSMISRPCPITNICAGDSSDFIASRNSISFRFNIFDGFFSRILSISSPIEESLDNHHTRFSKEVGKY